MITNATDFNLTKEKEIEYLKDILKELAKESEKITKLTEEDKEAIAATQRYMHEKVYDMDPMEIAANRQMLENMVDSAYNLLAKNRRLQRMINSPYFGRISFFFDDKKSADGIKRGSPVDNRGNFQIYIGVHSFIKDIKNIIYDWRSPIASMFYDYETGRAQYIAPRGTMTGDIIIMFSEYILSFNRYSR